MIFSTDKVMNADRALPRWVRDHETEAATLTDAERAVLAEVLRSLRRLTHGSIEIVVQDSKVVQIGTTEKKRL